MVRRVVRWRLYLHGLVVAVVSDRNAQLTEVSVTEHLGGGVGVAGLKIQAKITK